MTENRYDVALHGNRAMIFEFLGLLALYFKIEDRKYLWKKNHKIYNQNQFTIFGASMEMVLSIKKTNIADKINIL